MVTLPTMPLVEVGVHTLPSTACFCELALFLACTTVVFVIPYIHALVVAACGVLHTHQTAHLFVLVAVISSIRVFNLSKEAAHPLGREKNVVLTSGRWWW